MAVVYKFKCEKCGLVFHKKYFFETEYRGEVLCPDCKTIINPELVFF